MSTPGSSVLRFEGDHYIKVRCRFAKPLAFAEMNRCRKG